MGLSPAGPAHFCTAENRLQAILSVGARVWMGPRKTFSADAQGYRLRNPFPVEVVAEATRVEASLWARCKCALEAELPEQQFNTWVRPLQALEGAGALKLLAPNRFAVEWINEHLLPRIGELLRDESTGDAPIVTVEVGSRSSPMRAAVAPATPSGASPTQRPRRAEGLVVGARLNADFTFGTFVEGKSNQLAKAASR